MIWIYDSEVFQHDWLVVFKEYQKDNYVHFWNDNDDLSDFINEDDIYIGFNSKNYDQYIIKSILLGYIPEDVKSVNDVLISGVPGWQIDNLKDYPTKTFNNVDIMLDMQLGQSLKSIEGHFGMNIEESDVDFNIKTALTSDQKDKTLFYCKHDVYATEKVVETRTDYLKNKIKIGAMAGLSKYQSMAMTNAKLTSKMLKASAHKYNDEKAYYFPDKLLEEYIPKEILKLYKDFADYKILSPAYEFNIGQCNVKVGLGGIHGAIPNYKFTENGDQVIRNEDVSSYYPHLMTLFNYTSRSIPDAKNFEDVLNTRMAAKAKGDKKTANALKLVVNTTYGAMLNEYNDLYDPLMGHSVCITGQLFLLELAEHLYKSIKGLEIVQLNTDGIMIQCKKHDLDQLKAICDEWQKRTGFEFEEDAVKRIFQKDVNNYIEEQDNGSVKEKGGYLVRGISNKGAWKINNECTIIPKAIKAYFLDGRSPEETINKCNDIKEFMIIAKASHKYRQVYQLIDGKKVTVQQCNRVYATSNVKYGKLYKIHAETGQISQMPGLPDHCLIDNKNIQTIDNIDKQFYIKQCLKKISDFIGHDINQISLFDITDEFQTRKEITMDKTKTKASTDVKAAEKTVEYPNVYSKLAKARSEFLKASVSKSGKNNYMQFKYFELSDIVPVAVPIFEKLGLTSIVQIKDNEATMTIVNQDAPDLDFIVFSLPYTQLEATKGINSIQAEGASITYMRRYLYMIALDVCEPDMIDTSSGKPSASTNTTDTTTATPASKKAAKSKIPASKEERKEITLELTNSNGKADDLQITALKNVLKKWVTERPEKQKQVDIITLKTNGFKNITKKECEALIKNITESMK